MIRRISIGIISQDKSSNLVLTIEQEINGFKITSIEMPHEGVNWIEVYAVHKEVGIAKLWKTFISQPIQIEYDAKSD